MATKKAATKKATKKTAPEATKGRKGRVSAYAGLKIKKLVKTEDTGLRATGKVRECWDAIGDKMISVEDYRAAAPDSGLARRVLADFIAKGFCEVK